MKKIITTLLVLALAVTGCVFALTGCKSSGEKTLTVGFDAEYPPFTYEENGEFAGFDIEYAKKVCETLGYKIQLKAIDWNAKDEALKTGLIDCIWSGFTYEDREDKYAWTVRYLDNTIVVLTNSDQINAVADLSGKLVGVQSDSSGETALKKQTELVASFSGGNYSTDASYTTSFTKLKTGAYDAIVVDVGVANFLLSKMDAAEAAGYKVLSEKISVETYGVGFRLSDTELCKEVSDAMEKVAQDVTFVKGLCEKYGIDYNVFTLGK